MREITAGGSLREIIEGDHGREIIEGDHGREIIEGDHGRGIIIIIILILTGWVISPRLLLRPPVSHTLTDTKSNQIKINSHYSSVTAVGYILICSQVGGYGKPKWTKFSIET